MKKMNFIKLVMLSVIIALTSCSRDPEDRLPGDWIMTWTMTSSGNYGGESETETYLQVGTATFNEDGTGIMTMDGEVEAIIWTATEDKVTLSIDGDAIVFDVVENERKVQKWNYSDSGSYTDYTYDEDYNYTPYTYTYEYNLEVKLDKK